MANILIINAHKRYEGWSEGTLNRHLANEIDASFAGAGHDVRHSHIDGGYDIGEEVDKHVWADVIVLQCPVNWFGAPWIHKKYLDEVFNDGLAQKKLITDDGRSRKDASRQYGMGGNMQGKKFMMSLTWNAPEAAFGNPDQVLYQGKTADDAFLHIAACYRFCGAEIVPSFSCYDVIKAPQIENDVVRLRAHLAAHFALKAKNQTALSA
ncbi:NAD(P)H-dependent oxidoreductase [Thalassospira profundimaris]|uniref:NAD(P)H-dependent oxidoreductase n=1 Tax=Thalassospira profundimaris TaxID=502049 RepID=UPI000DEDAB70|nr:NAD(P)H-dependent oxidoreductase [Thalassospira profundimaris]